MKAALERGPQTVAVQANGTFMKYKKGIMNNCRGTRLDHAIAAVGYGTEGGKDYWIVRNSWGTSWGERGYIRMEAEDGNG